MFDKIKN